jgi:type VI secretion system protein ImpL
MNTVIEFFKKKWVIQLLGIIALSLLIWFFGSLIAIAGHVPLESDIVRLLVILAIVVLWGLNNLRIQVKANRANAQMTQDLVAPADAEANHLTREADAEISTIANNFDAALQTLKKGAKNAQGKNYLYDLPWYIIIGPPGSGKTTALINSGLEFPLADKFGKGAVRGVGGTRNCDWWFTDQAVLLDTAGRYVTQDSHEAIDKAAWLGFLDLLKKHRPRRPVNGVLITMSLSDLLKQTEEERSLHAQSIRQRIEELHTHFGIRFPIYMLFTKADLVAGFNDFFATLSKEERAQVWGVTFPAEDPDSPIDVIARVGNDFDDLLNRINAHLPRRLQEERDLSRRNLIFGFPQRMALLREGLLSFLQECYGANRYQSAPYLRGVYFTSGTQEGTPIDRLMGMLANTFKLDRTNTPLFSGTGKSYFITRLLKDVIFEEALLVGVNPRIERLQTLLRQGVYAASLAIIVLMSGLWLTSYNKNQTALDELNQKIQQYDTVAAATPNWQTDFSALLKRMNAMQAIKQVYADDVPWLMTFGLYQGDKLQPVITDTYNDLLQKQFLPLIKTRLEQRIREKTNNPDILYSLLEVYLMLGDTKHFKAESVQPWITVDWQNTYSTDTETQAKLLEHLTVLLKLPPEKQVLNETLVRNTRQILSVIPAEKQIYMRIKTELLQTKNQDFNLVKALGISADRVFATKNGTLEQQTIPYLFTYDGFYNVFLKQVKEQAEASMSGSWILGDAAKKEAITNEALESAVRDYYYKDYIQYWDDLLANLRIKPVSNNAQTVEVLQFAAAPDSPLRKLLETLNKETSLTIAPPSPADMADKLQQAGAVKNPLDSRVIKALDVAKTEGLVGKTEPLGKPVEEHFQSLTMLVKSQSGSPAPIEQTMQLLKQLSDSTTTASSTSSPDIAAINQVASAVAAAKAQSSLLPEPLKSMTQSLSNAAQGTVTDSSKNQLSRLWESEVIPLYSKGIQGRYPFARNSSKDVALEDFGHFFAPSGVVDTFFNTNLKSFVDTSGKTWRMISRNDQTIAISPNVLTQIQAAKKLQQMFFANGGTVASIRFNLKPVSLTPNATAFWLNIEGQQSQYKATDMSKITPFSWPGTDGSRLVSFGFETTGGQKPSRQVEGAWAWFRALEMARIQRIDAEKYRLTFDIDGMQAIYELSANSVDNPFSMKEFDAIRFPSSL